MAIVNYLDFLIKRGLTRAQWADREIIQAMMIADHESRINEIALDTWTNTRAYYDSLDPAEALPFGRLVVGDTDGILYRFIGDRDTDEDDNNPQGDSYDGSGLGTYYRKIDSAVAGLDSPIVTTFNSVGANVHNFNASTGKALLILTGAGGGGEGGHPSDTYAKGNDGAAGSTAFKLIAVSADGITTGTITLGALGVGGASNTAGGDAAESSYSDGTNTVTVDGAEGGTGQNRTAIAQPGAVAGADFSILGQTARAGSGRYIGSTDGGARHHAASSFLGYGESMYGDGDNDNVNDQTQPGAGGLGGDTNESTAMEAGGDGGPAKSILIEF